MWISPAISPRASLSNSGRLPPTPGRDRRFREEAVFGRMPLIWEEAANPGPRPSFQGGDAVFERMRLQTEAQTCKYAGPCFREAIHSLVVLIEEVISVNEEFQGLAQ